MGGCGSGALPVSATIAWWGWLAVWSVLVLSLVVMLGVFAWVLFRKGLGVLDAVAQLADSSAVLDAEERALTPPQRAILADLRDIRAREAARRFRRAERRRQRLDRRLARARRITTLDASRHPWPTDWYPTARSRSQRVSLTHSHPHSEGS
jgi:hypothetical protein